MNIADQVERIASAEVAAPKLTGKRSQLKELADVEAVLASIGVSLEPVFDICLTTRIGASPMRRKS